MNSTTVISNFSYSHSLYEVLVKDADQAAFANELENQIPIDIFMYASPERSGRFLVPKLSKPQFEYMLAAQGIDFKIEVENIRE